MLSPEDRQEVERMRDEIQRILLQYFSAIHAELIHSHDDVFLTDKILRTIGYIPSKDQSLPKNPYTTEYKYQCQMDVGMPQGLVVNDKGYIAYAEAQQDMGNRLKCINIDKEGENV